MFKDKCKKCKRMINGVCCHPGRDLSKKGKIVPLKSWLKFKKEYPDYKNYCGRWAINTYKVWLQERNEISWSEIIQPSLTGNNSLEIYNKWCTMLSEIEKTTN